MRFLTDFSKQSEHYFFSCNLRHAIFLRCLHQAELKRQRSASLCRYRSWRRKTRSRIPLPQCSPRPACRPTRVTFTKASWSSPSTWGTSRSIAFKRPFWRTKKVTNWHFTRWAKASFPSTMDSVWPLIFLVLAAAHWTTWKLRFGTTTWSCRCPCLRPDARVIKWEFAIRIWVIFCHYQDLRLLKKNAFYWGKRYRFCFVFLKIGN